MRAVMSMMTDDCVFLSSAGDEVDGKRIAGQAAVREAFAAGDVRVRELLRGEGVIP